MTTNGRTSPVIGWLAAQERPLFAFIPKELVQFRLRSWQPSYMVMSALRGAASVKEVE